MGEVTSMSQGPVFALDIGTHKVAGLLIRKCDDSYCIDHSIMLEQLPQAMRDGQIHHIEKVARTIKQVKAHLEKASGISLHRAAVAAAGRSLKTRAGSAKRILHPADPLTLDDAKALELQAVANAMADLAHSTPRSALENYLCVGCSVVRSYLDGEPIGSLVGHRGSEAGMDVIATFLPRVVIDSLITALQLAGLDIASITLEPIAAMHVVVPTTMRMLNIALVDIGAGTSDIAVAAEGTITGYGMVACGGDRITEAIAKHFLLDFTAAEKAKQLLAPGTAAACEDVLGNTLHLDYEEVMAVIRPVVQDLAAEITAQITALNGSSPKGVLLVGGGSQTPELATLIQENLGLSPNLVRIRDRTSLQRVEGHLERSGPDVVTPIGIGCSYLDGITMELVKATINGRALQFLKLPSSTVSNALLYAGYTQEDLTTVGGEFITVSIGGKAVELPPTSGAAAQVRVNGEPADLSTPVRDGDIIEVLPPDETTAAPTTLADLVDGDAACFAVSVNGEEVLVQPQITVNGVPQRLDYQIGHGDNIEITHVQTVGELLESRGVQQYRTLSFTVNGEERTLSRPVKLIINGEAAPYTKTLRPGMEITCGKPQVTLGEVLPRAATAPISIKVNGESLQLTPTVTGILVNGTPQSLDYLVQPGDIIHFDSRSFGFIVTDIFRVYQPDPEFLARGGQITVNGLSVGFTAPLKDGDVVELRAAAPLTE
jgi:cell division ATPase FtsA